MQCTGTIACSIQVAPYIVHAELAYTTISKHALHGDNSTSKMIAYVSVLQALPTLLVFKDGKQADRIEGNDAGRMLINGQLLTDRLQYLLFSKAGP